MGNTPLSLASFNNHIEVMEVLLEHGAAVDLQTDVRQTYMYNIILGTQFTSLSFITESVG